MPKPSKMARTELENRVRELEHKNQLLKKALQQATESLEKSSEKNTEWEKALQKAMEDSSDELSETKLEKDETEEALANLEKTAEDAIERLDEVGRW